MPWNETSAMDQRMHFIADYLEDFFPFSELCRRYGISRPTGYKWVQRYVDTGAAGLMAQSRRPVRCPHATSSDLVEAILGRAAHTRRGGPRSCWRSSGDRSRIAPGRHAHRLRHPQTPWPGADAADAAPAGLCGATPDPPERAQSRLDRRLQGAVQDPGWPLLLPADRRDGYSRFLLGCQALDAPQGQLSRPVFHRLFRTYGLPRILRTDNGAPFASSQALGRLSQLSVWWIRLGILPERIQPGCPQQNGRHERLHGTLKREATIPPAASRFGQQYRFTRFRHEYNQERPHEALGQRPPVEFYQPSPRPFPRKLPPLHYPAHWEVRRVSTNGGIRWKTHRVAVSNALRQQPIGLEPIDDGVWEVWFGPLRLGRMDERQLTITDALGKAARRKLYTMLPDYSVQENRCTL